MLVQTLPNFGRTFELGRVARPLSRSSPKCHVNNKCCFCQSYQKTENVLIEFRDR